MKKAITITFILTLLLTAGCATMNQSDKDILREIQSYGIPANDQRIKDPALAGALNVLPGIGNFYLASGTNDDTGQWVYGFLNLLFYPASIFWGVPQAIIDADIINQKETVYYYRFDKRGKIKLKRLRAGGKDNLPLL